MNASVWTERFPEYAYGDLASHEWSKHGSCAALGQLDYFRLIDAKVAPLIEGEGGSLLTRSLGANVSHADLSAAFERDASGRRVALSCSDHCALSDVWIAFDLSFEHIDCDDADSCARCEHIYIIDVAKDGCSP